MAERRSGLIVVATEPESPEYTGRAVVASAKDVNVMGKSGTLVYVADLAEEYDFADLDGVRVANFYKVIGLAR